MIIIFKWIDQSEQYIIIRKILLSQIKIVIGVYYFTAKVLETNFSTQIYLNNWWSDLGPAQLLSQRLLYQARIGDNFFSSEFNKL